MRRRRPGRHWQRGAEGYTLIELLVVIAIVAVLALVALPSYRSHVLRTHRAIARATLIELAARLEAERLKQGRYPASLDFHLAGRAGATSGARQFTIRAGGQIDVGRDAASLYEIHLEPLSGASPQDAFRLTARAINAQTGDRHCLELSVDSTGRRGPIAGQGLGGDCWIR